VNLWLERENVWRSLHCALEIEIAKLVNKLKLQERGGPSC